MARRGGDDNDPGSVLPMDRMFRTNRVMREEEDAHFGQRIRSETSPDKSSDRLVDQHEALMGRTMGGGPLDISHSIGGEPEEVETYNDRGRKPRPWRSQGLNEPDKETNVRKQLDKRRG